mmetsp:Transcript_71681/g.184864  ORF Transcript_71681/g.184864 Transcript_71681/m.184864 type:complete len:234 (+) Transcript_71681:1601-2302(+)
MVALRAEVAEGARVVVADHAAADAIVVRIQQRRLVYARDGHLHATHGVERGVGRGRRKALEVPLNAGEALLKVVPDQQRHVVQRFMLLLSLGLLGLNEPVVPERARGPDAMLPLRVQELAHEVLRDLRRPGRADPRSLLYALEEPGEDVSIPDRQVALQELVSQQPAGPVHEGVLVGQQEDHHRADGPHVHLVVVAGASVGQEMHLGRHEGRRPHLLLEQLLLRQLHRDAEVA